MECTHKTWTPFCVSISRVLHVFLWRWLYWNTQPLALHSSHLIIHNIINLNSTKLHLAGRIKDLLEIEVWGSLLNSRRLLVWRVFEGAYGGVKSPCKVCVRMSRSLTIQHTFFQVCHTNDNSMYSMAMAVYLKKQ